MCSRFAAVSKQWRQFVRHNSQLCDRRKTFLLQRKQYYLQKGKVSYFVCKVVKTETISPKYHKNVLICFLFQ